MTSIDIFSGKASHGMVKAILHQLEYGEFILQSPIWKHGQQVGYSVLFLEFTPTGKLFLEQLRSETRPKMYFYHKPSEKMQFWYAQEDVREYDTALIIDLR